MTTPQALYIDLAMKFISRVGFPIAACCGLFYFGLDIKNAHIKFLENEIDNARGLTKAVQLLAESSSAEAKDQARQAETLDRIDRGQDRVIEILGSLKAERKEPGT